MATIQMTNNNFTVCPEGRHVFRIYKVDFNPDFGKVVVYMVNAQGITHRENFGLMRADGSMNEEQILLKFFLSLRPHIMLPAKKSITKFTICSSKSIIMQ